MRRNTVMMDPYIPVYFTKNDKKFVSEFKPNSDAGSIMDQAKFLLRNDKEKPKNEETLTYYLQLVHENIMAGTIVE